MLTVYGDDSSDEKQQRVFAAAALIGTQEAWDSLEPAWKERTGGIPYHTTDCLAGHESYKGWSKEKRYSLHNDLTHLIVDFPIVGHAYVMDLPSFAEFFGGVKRTERFLHCFSHMVGGACAIIRGYNTIHEKKQKKQRAKFVFDSDNDNVNAGYLFSVLKKMKRWDELTADCEGPVEFAFPGNKPVGIQAADIWAYEVRNEFDNKVRGIEATTYASSLFSLENPRFNRNEYFRSKIIDAKKRIDQMDSGSEYSAYKQWLQKHRRQDNANSKIAFVAFWDAQVRKKQ
ncbi:MAG: hypothetical protein ABSB95_00340 [Dissulfurispiraceae bacterium]|jgi:hypothetical protein